MKALKQFFLISIIGILFSQTLSAQFQEIEDINGYKYILIPMRFQFQSKDNEYLLSSLVKHLFDENGYRTHLKNKMVPDDLAKNNCLGLTAQLEADDPDLFSFTLEVRLKLIDCKNKVIYKSSGSSREKKYKEAYKDAVRKAFRPLETFEYKWNGTEVMLLSSKNKNGQNAEDQMDGNLSKIETALENQFKWEGKQFDFSAIEAGYILTEIETGERFGFIYTTSKNNYQFSSKKRNGSFSFEENGDLSVEYLNKEKGQVETITFKKIDK